MPVEVVGVKDVLAGLEFIDEDMRQRIRTAIDPLMRGVAFKAKGFVKANEDVLSGWAKASGNPGTFPKYDSNVVRAGIGYNPGENKTFRNGFKVSNYVYNASRPGAIYEVAGRLNPQGRAPFQMTHHKAQAVHILKNLQEVEHYNNIILITHLLANNSWLH